ncbi:MAG TPA: YbaK/EbsC family protein [Candidatus Eisenbacteria bacterium]|nr:YbaK/EbsC family protein [Candidatus Eisenbacteria bacterium]
MISETVRAALERLQSPWEIMPIDPAFADTEAFCRKYGVPAERSANTIIVASKKEPKQFCACVVLADSRLDVNRRVRQLMSVPRASFATAEEMKALTGMEVGGVTPFGLPPDLPLYVDARVMEPSWVILGAGGRSAKVRISPNVFIELNATVVTGLGISPSEA